MLHRSKGVGVQCMGVHVSSPVKSRTQCFPVNVRMLKYKNIKASCAVDTHGGYDYQHNTRVAVAP